MTDSYTIERQTDRLTVRTGSFRTAQRSVLHSGIYNREMTSILFAAGVGLLYILAIALVQESAKVLNYIIAGVLFVISFPLARAFLFKEASLSTTLDKKRKVLTMVRSGIIRARTIERPLGDVMLVRVQSVKLAPPNPDGVAFVEKIAVQHGTVIPGFGQTQMYYTVELVLAEGAGGPLAVYSSENKKDSEQLALLMEDFLVSP